MEFTSVEIWNSPDLGASKQVNLPGLLLLSHKLLFLRLLGLGHGAEVAQTQVLEVAKDLGAGLGGHHQGHVTNIGPVKHLAGL